MDSKELRGLMEAYAEVYAPQEVDEAQRPVYGRGGGLQRTQTALQVLGKHATARDKKKLHNIPKGGTTIGTGDSGKLMSGEYDRGKGSKAARRAAALTKPEPKKSFPNRLRRSDGQGIRDSYEYDIFDLVLEFLQTEGYAETLEEAEWLMANVIDDEAIEIVIGEAQEARNNPDKYEREQQKKTAPVRGERTPMPPRGDKRREDFEKWYAANVR
jgi:hypothetical protein